MCFIIEQDIPSKINITIAGYHGVGKSSIISHYITGSYLSYQYTRSHYQEHAGTNIILCVRVCYLQYGSEVYMCYITFELQTVEKIQTIINPLQASNSQILLRM